MNNKIKKQIYNSTKDSVENSIYNSVYDSVVCSVRGSFGYQFINSIWDAINISVGNYIGEWRFKP